MHVIKCTRLFPSLARRAWEQGYRCFRNKLIYYQKQNIAYTKIKEQEFQGCVNILTTLELRLSVPDFVSQLWRKITVRQNPEQKDWVQGKHLPICLYHTVFI